MQNKAAKCVPSTRIRAILPQKISSIKVDSQQMLRDVVTDFVIQNLSVPNHMNGRRSKQIRYQPTAVGVNLNGCRKEMEFGLFTILERYLQHDKQHLDNKQKGIQSTVADLVDFVETIEKDREFCTLDIEGSTAATKILDVMIAKHKKKRQKVLFQGQFEEAKQNIYAKYKKMSCTDLDSISNGSQVWRDFQNEQYQPNQGIKTKNALEILEKDQFNHKQKPLPTKSKLKQLIDSCNIFEEPERVESLRQEKLVSYFCKNERELLDARHEIRSKVMNGQKMKNVGHLAVLEEWIAEISLSEYLFRKKYEPKVQKKGQRDEKPMSMEDINSSEEQIQ